MFIFSLIDKASAMLRKDPYNSKALHILERAQEGAKDPRHFLQIGLLYLELNQPKKAQENLQKARELAPKNPAAQLFASVAEIDLQNYQEAQNILDELKKICPDNQAAPTLQALLFLKQNRLTEAMELLRPKKGKFDLSVSERILTRFAVTVESFILPLELPQSLENDLETDLIIPKAKKAKKKVVENDDETEETPTTEKTAKDEEEEAPPKTTLTSVLNAESSSLAARGARRLARAWSLPGEKRLQEIDKAHADLKKAYEKNPRIPQLAYDLGESILGKIEFSHKKGKPISEQELERLEEAYRLFYRALYENSENSYTLHYLGRVSFLQRKINRAITSWKLALKYFEKLPESAYGLAQANVLLGNWGEARSYMARALNSDPQLLRERLRDLEEFVKAKSSDRAVEPAPEPQQSSDQNL
ncbi:tetratricopeptide repeat protein [bacterium]|nr:tetratricopeptide repeat protein [bacterium]